MNILLLQKQECCQTSNISFPENYCKSFGRTTPNHGQSCMHFISLWLTDWQFQHERTVGRAGGCQTSGTPYLCNRLMEIFSIWSSVELSRPVVVHCHLPICPIWACPLVKNLSNLAQIESRLWGKHISETARWIYPFKVPWTCLDL